MTTYISTPHSAIETDDSQLLFLFVSLLLHYPDEEVMETGELRQLIEELPNSEAVALLLQFIDYLESESFEDLAQNYVNTFDFNPKTNLYLTYSATGEERERGEILVRIKRFYSEAGFEVATDELPDYLPLILEFISVAPPEFSTKALKDFRGAIENLMTELEKNESPYACLLKACLLQADQVIN